MKAMSPSSNSMKFESLFNRRKFETIELETLYQRYIFKHQQSSIFQVLFILLLLSVTLSILHFAHASISLIAIYCVVQSAVFSIILLLNQVKIIEKDNHFMMITRITMVSCFIFALISLPISVSSIISNQENYSPKNSPKNSLNYSLNYSLGMPGSPDGVWEIILVTFLVYSLIPIRTRFALIFGLVVSMIHLLVTLCCSNGYLFTDQIWRQASSFYTLFSSSPFLLFLSILLSLLLSFSLSIPLFLLFSFLFSLFLCSFSFSSLFFLLSLVLSLSSFFPFLFSSFLLFFFPFSY